jgi:hypothetical protein
MQCALLHALLVTTSSAEHNTTENAGLGQPFQHSKLTTETAIILAQAISTRYVVVMVLVLELEGLTSLCSLTALNSVAIRQSQRPQDHIRIQESWVIQALDATLKAPTRGLCQMKKRWSIVLWQCVLLPVLLPNTFTLVLNTAKNVGVEIHLQLELFQQRSRIAAPLVLTMPPSTVVLGRD